MRYRKPVSVVTRRLLHRLDAESIRDLAICREWLDLGNSR
jgi:hypothetical protein